MLRFEYKYIIPNEKLSSLREMIRPFMKLDKYAQRNGGEYTVRSIYFDTPDLECYLHKEAGVKRRNKLRMRGYNTGENGEGIVFFEIKKKVDDPLYKNRAPMTYADAQRVLQGETIPEVLAMENSRRFLYHLHARRMHPVVTVIYEREPFQSLLNDRANDLRITFDKNLRAVPYPSLDALFDEKGAKRVDPAHFIMEVKFNYYLPAWVKTVIASFGLKKGPASKYGLSIETLGLSKVRPWQSSLVP